MTREELRDALAAAIADCTAGDLSTAERHVESEWLECPMCDGQGEVEATDYCNFDGVALGVQFYGIGPHFGAHERLWRLFTDNLPTILASLDTEAVKAETEACARLATSFLVGDPKNGVPLRNPMPHEIAAAIRARKEQQP